MAPIQRGFQNLNAHTQYVFRVRAVNGLGVYSDWSDALIYTTPGATNVPMRPDQLAIDFTSPDLLISWSAPTTNVDGSPLIDITEYEISLTVGNITKNYFSSAASFTYTFVQNALDFGTAQPVIEVAVRAISSGGAVSDTLTGLAINVAPSTPVAPLTAAAFTIIVVTMFEPADMRDFLDFTLQHSIDGQNWTVLTKTTHSSYSHQVPQGSTHYYQYQVEDVFRQVSNLSAVTSATTLIALQPDIVPPSIPTGLVAQPGIDPTTQVPYVDFFWNPVTTDQDGTTCLDLNRYELRIIQTAPGVV